VVRAEALKNGQSFYCLAADGMSDDGYCIWIDGIVTTGSAKCAPLPPERIQRIVFNAASGSGLFAEQEDSSGWDP